MGLSFFMIWLSYRISTHRTYTSAMSLTLMARLNDRIGRKISVPHLLPYSVGNFLAGFFEGLRREGLKDGIPTRSSASPTSLSTKGCDSGERSVKASHH